MRILGPGTPAIRLSARHTASETREPEVPASESRALIAIGPASPSERSRLPTRHPGAAFLAQLIATQMQAPQTRARRRAEPEEAIAVYRSMTKPVMQRRRAFGRSA